MEALKNNRKLEFKFQVNCKRLCCLNCYQNSTNFCTSIYSRDEIPNPEELRSKLNEAEAKKKWKYQDDVASSSQNALKTKVKAKKGKTHKSESTRSKKRCKGNCYNCGNRWNLASVCISNQDVNEFSANHQTSDVIN